LGFANAESACGSAPYSSTFVPPATDLELNRRVWSYGHLFSPSQEKIPLWVVPVFLPTLATVTSTPGSRSKRPIPESRCDLVDEIMVQIELGVPASLIE